MPDGKPGIRPSGDVPGRLGELWSGSESLWVRDPSERFVERLWTRDGWSNVVRDGDGSPEGTDDQFTPEDAADWPTPMRARVNGRTVTVGVITAAALAAAALWGLRRSSKGKPSISSEQGLGKLPDGTQSTIMLGPAGNGRSGGMTEVPLAKQLDFTPAGELTIHLSNGSVQRVKALSAAEFAEKVPDSIRHIPEAFVISTPMKN